MSHYETRHYYALPTFWRSFPHKKTRKQPYKRINFWSFPGKRFLCVVNQGGQVRKTIISVTRYKRITRAFFNLRREKKTTNHPSRVHISNRKKDPTTQMLLSIRGNPWRGKKTTSLHSKEGRHVLSRKDSAAKLAFFIDDNVLHIFD